MDPQRWMPPWWGAPSVGRGEPHLPGHCRLALSAAWGACSLPLVPAGPRFAPTVPFYRLSKHQVQCWVHVIETSWRGVLFPIEREVWPRSRKSGSLFSCFPCLNLRASGRNAPGVNREPCLWRGQSHSCSPSGFIMFSSEGCWVWFPKNKEYRGAFDLTAV